MISDALHEASMAIRGYLDWEATPYGDRGTPLRDWIESVVAQMDALRIHLDTPPSVAQIRAHRRIANGLNDLPDSGELST